MFCFVLFKLHFINIDNKRVSKMFLQKKNWNDEELQGSILDFNSFFFVTDINTLKIAIIYLRYLFVFFWLFVCSCSNYNWRAWKNLSPKHYLRWKLNAEHFHALKWFKTFIYLNFHTFATHHLSFILIWLFPFN